jgi:peptidoglycan hydrolase-like protein with peptidoglycan-binding domain
MRRRLVLAVLAALVAAPAAQAADPEVAALQVALRAKGMYFGALDGVAGPQTAEGLRAFQLAAELPVTGELGPHTRAELGALGRPLVARRVLSQGAYGWDVSALQFLLARAGHLRLYNVDGFFGGATADAVEAFQQSRGLAVDGVAGPATMTAFGLGAATPVLAQPAAAPTGAYVVRPGDTLSAIAARHNTSIRALASVNRLSSPDLVVEGAKLKIPAASASGASLDLDRSTVRAYVDKWAAHHGVPQNLARALAWQESGFQVNVTSSANAWGPMQVIPSSWDFVETVLLGRDVPRTGEGGVQVGMALLAHLLKEFDGDQRLALAAWYQGAAAVRQHGLYDETKTFVANVLALSGRPL